MANATGLGPLDVGTIVQKLMIGQQSGLRKLQTKQKIEQAQISVYGQLQSLINTFQTQLTNLGSAFSVIGYEAVSSNNNIITASITNNVVAQGAHSITINQLAMAQSYTSQKSFLSENNALGAVETLTFTNQNDANINFSISLSATDTLDDIRDNINNSLMNKGVTASIVRGTATDNTTPNYYLSLTSKATGTVNSFTVSGDTGNIFNMTQQVAAKDAMFTFDGINMVRPSNIVTDAMDGLSINLLSTTANNTPATISINANNQNQIQSVKTAMQSMLDAYNQVINYIDQNTNIFYTEENAITHEVYTKKIRNDSFPLVKTILQDAIGQTINGLGNITTLNDAGIVLSDMKSLVIPNTKNTYNTYGELEFYKGKDGKERIDEMLENNYGAFQNFFTNFNSGFITKLNNTLNKEVLGNGAIYNVTQTLNQQLNRVDNDISDEEQRLKSIQDGLIIKYSTLNSLLAKFQSTSDFLERQFASLNNSNHK